MFLSQGLSPQLEVIIMAKNGSETFGLETGQFPIRWSQYTVGLKNGF